MYKCDFQTGPENGFSLQGLVWRDGRYKHKEMVYGLTVEGKELNRLWNLAKLKNKQTNKNRNF